MKKLKCSSIGYIFTAITSLAIETVVKDTDAAILVLLMGFSISYYAKLRGK